MQIQWETNFKHAQTSKHLCSLCSSTISPDKTKQFQGRQHNSTIRSSLSLPATYSDLLWYSWGGLLMQQHNTFKTFGAVLGASCQSVARPIQRQVEVPSVSTLHTQYYRKLSYCAKETVGRLHLTTAPHKTAARCMLHSSYSSAASTWK